jgi:microcystin-dependent protein
MAKTKVSEWDVVADNNQDISGITLGTGMPPSYVNDSIREMMSQIKDWQSGSSGDDYTITGNLGVNGTLTINGSSGTSGQVLVSQGDGVIPKWGDAFITGMIMLWSGATDAVPAGWSLCDGTGNTPDLRDRFVVGAGNSYDVNATGGSKDAIAVSHTHTGSTNATGNHSHTIPHHLVQAVGGTGDIDRDNEYQQWKALSGQKTNTTGNHSHTVSINSAGSSGANANLPPYYALAYIMKV